MSSPSAAGSSARREHDLSGSNEKAEKGIQPLMTKQEADPQYVIQRAQQNIKSIDKFRNKATAIMKEVQ